MEKKQTYKIIPAGAKFGRWTVMSYAGKGKSRNALWLCKCDCGNEKVVTGKCLRSGDSQSCGCLCRDKLVATHTTHNQSYSRTYRIWVGMRVRCYHKKYSGYKNYGARGIGICPQWRDCFATFFADMGECPPGKSIDRINNDGNYEPENCRWATHSDQVRNSRRARLITYNGETHCIVAWSEILGISYKALSWRVSQNGTLCKSNGLLR